MTSTINPNPTGPSVAGPKRLDKPKTPQGKAGKWAEERLGLAAGARKQLNKVFPDHWSFMMGEIALYSFIILILTGTFLTFFFDASMADVRYNGSYIPLDGVEMSRAYASTLHISFDVRGGLVMRQIHHWAALLFMAAMTVHMFRVFFTGAFRKPRELNWLIGLGLITSVWSRGSPGTRCLTTCCRVLGSGSPRRSCNPSRSSVAGPRSLSSVASSPAPRSSAGSTSSTSCWCPASWPV